MRLRVLRDSEAKGLTRINTDLTDKGGLFCGASICFGLGDFSFEGFFWRCLSQEQRLSQLAVGKIDLLGLWGVVVVCG
jgi:hypothetical protein